MPILRAVHCRDAAGETFDSLGPHASQTPRQHRWSEQQPQLNLWLAGSFEPGQLLQRGPAYLRGLLVNEREGRRPVPPITAKAVQQRTEGLIAVAGDDVQVPAWIRRP